MGDFDPYEQAEKLDTKGRVWSARKGAGAPLKYVIKFTPGPRGEPDGAARVTALRNAAELQKKMAARPSGGWGRIEVIGQTPDGGAYYVGDLYPLSLARLAARKHPISSPQLTAIAEQIVAGASEVASLYGRGHGNLKLGNVLLTDADLKTAKVLLSDPAPPGSTIAEDPLADRHGLGRVIFELVTGTPYQDDFWPLRHQKAWDSLGPDAAKWLDRCNRLLAAKGQNDAYTIGKFKAELAPVVETAAPPRGASKSIGGIAAALVIVALAGGGYWFLTQRKQVGVVTPPPTQPAPVAAPQAPTPPPTPPPAPAPTPPPTPAPAPASIPAPAPKPAPAPPSPPPAPKPAPPPPSPAELLRASVDNAIALARAASFRNPVIERNYRAWCDTQLTKFPLAAPILTGALSKLDSSWNLPPAPSPAIVASEYDGKLDLLLSNAIQAIPELQTPAQVDGAMAAFQIKAQILYEAAERASGRFQLAADVQAALASTSPTSLAQWIKFQALLAQPAPIGWPKAPTRPLLGQVNEVLDALQTSDVTLLQGDADAAGPPALLQAVCARWPALHGDPDTDAEIFQRLTHRLGRLPDATVAQAGDLWTARLRDQTDPAQAQHLIDLAGKMELPQSSALLASIYFNARLADLKSRVAEEGSPGQQISLAAAFVDQVSGFSGGGPAKATVDELARAIKQAQAPRQGGTLPPDFARDSAGDDLIYTPAFEPAHPLRFKRISVKSTGESFYLCTTEVTAGWFISLVIDQHKPVLWRKLLDFTVPGRLAGPSVWRASIIRGQITLNRDRGWLAVGNHNWDEQRDKYIPPGDGPSIQSPMQYVSPLAAMEAARIAGCRLPTVAEWQAAYESGLRDGDDNIGGANWAALRDSIAGLNPVPPSSETWRKFKMELGIENADGEKLPFAGPAQDQPTDVLWFRKAPTDATALHDMNGNVAEWVLSDTPDAPAPRLESDEPFTVVDETGEYVINGQDDPALSAFYQHCLRIGLTSTSAKGDDPEKAYLPVDERGNHHHQFYDVGFRLALDDPSAPPPGATLAAVVRGLKPIEP